MAIGLLMAWSNKFNRKNAAPSHLLRSRESLLR